MEIPETAALEKAEAHVLRALLLIVEREVTLPEAIDHAIQAELEPLAEMALPAAPGRIRSQIAEAFAAFRAAPEKERRTRASALNRMLIHLHLAIVEAKWGPLHLHRK